MTRDKVTAYIQDVKFGYLATIDAEGAPRVRPVGIYTVYGDNLLPPPAQQLFRLYRLEPGKVYWAEGMVPYTESVWS